MARTIDEIKQTITDLFISYEAVQNAYSLTPGLTFEQQFSKVSLESIFFYVVAFAVWTLESLFDIFLSSVDERIQNQRAHTLGWYRLAALNFQFGGVWRDDITEYNNDALTDDEIEAQRIVKKCSVTKADSIKPTLIVKVAKADGSPLTGDEKQAFDAYMEDVADAGVNISAISAPADRLVLYMTIRYDGMTLDANGMKFLDGSHPVADGVKQHLNALEWNGVFYPSMLEQYLMTQQGNGVRVATVRTAYAGVNGGNLSEIADKYEPYSGAIHCDTDVDLYVTYEKF
ncbi:hypothetical protein D0T49_00405 [Paludibacter sp. 221]|uniref:hypothetical protein n=1 Tax=Paludibacter sp. 221 TaxID=2302939 RepID=UPI0013D283B1|nr:hypothetical protein [Paludibacter sp. 221]NDV45514.1 hypothetical protein [Paludibacter sp. 221]